MKSPLVSIILPTYNRADILSRAVESVLMQTLSDWELHIVDDGSVDNTAELIKEFLSDKRIYYWPRPHLGVVKVINYGIKQAKAGVVTFLSSDDWYKKNHLKINLAYLNKHSEIDIIHSNAEIIGDRLVPDITQLGKMIELDECYLEGTLFIRDRVLKHIQFDDKGKLGEDYRLVHRAIAAGFKIYKLASRTYVYDRSRDDSLTKQIGNSKTT